MTLPCTSVSRRSMPLWRNGQLLVVDAEQMQDGGVQIVTVGLVDGGLIGELVALGRRRRRP